MILSMGMCKIEKFKSVCSECGHEKDKSYSVVIMPDGVECNHIGCKNHVTHPCEGCGRKGANGVAYVKIESII
jgi:hypothetical protein